MVRDISILLDFFRRRPDREELGDSTAEPSKSVWDDSPARYARGDFKTYWEALEQVSKQQAKLMTGGETEDVLSWLVELIRRRVGGSGLRGLSIGCAAAAAPEIAFARSGLFGAIDVVDLAGGLLEKQSTAASEKGVNWIHYLQRDLEEIRLEPNSYDVIWAIGTIHHLERLEALFVEINRGLSERGLFFMREYVGPDRLQLSEEQLRRANRVLAWLPEEFRLRWDGSVKQAAERVDLDVLLAEDPSEAIRSSAIIPALHEALAVDRVVPTGGTLLMPLLDGIAGRFGSSPQGEALLSHLMQFEQLLVANGQLPSDYVFAIAHKQP